MSTNDIKRPTTEFKIEFRDRIHFYKVIKWLNMNVGHGAKCWTMHGRVLKYLREGDSRLVTVIVFEEGFAEENALFLSLI